MTLKELIRAAICGEMEDISACKVDAAAFGAAPGGKKPAELYEQMIEEKRTRLLDLGRIFKEGTGFRQRSIPHARSLEASLRYHAARAGAAAVIYADLMKVMNKPEFKAVMKALSERERAVYAQLKAMQAGLKKD
jgi:hypothetical protein